jgi:hypothetical protein
MSDEDAGLGFVYSGWAQLRQSQLIVQPTGAALDDLKLAVRVFHGLIKAGIRQDRLILVEQPAAASTRFIARTSQRPDGSPAHALGDSHISKMPSEIKELPGPS